VLIGAVARDAGTRAGEQTVRGVRWEPAEVWLNDGRPARFGWRGRIYTVLAILERPPAEPEPASERSDPDQVSWRRWRVSASPERNVPAQAYRLCHDAASGRWLLSRDS
jgi:hypothetical protein